MLQSVKSAAARFDDDLSAGDVIVGNLPDLNGTHLLDVDLAMPIFAEERAVGSRKCKSCSTMIDLNGPAAGGYNLEASELDAEGLGIH